MVTSVGQDTVTGLATRAPDRRSTESQSRFLLVGEIHAAVLYLPVAEGAQGFYVGHPVNSEPHSWEMVLCSWWWSSTQTCGPRSVAGVLYSVGEIGEVLRHLILCCDISTLSCLVSCFVYEKYF